MFRLLLVIRCSTNAILKIHSWKDQWCVPSLLLVSSCIFAVLCFLVSSVFFLFYIRAVVIKLGYAKNETFSSSQFWKCYIKAWLQCAPEIQYLYWYKLKETKCVCVISNLPFLNHHNFSVQSRCRTEGGHTLNYSSSLIVLSVIFP